MEVKLLLDFGSKKPPIQTRKQLYFNQEILKSGESWFKTINELAETMIIV